MSPFFEIIPIFEGFLQGNLFDFLSTYDRNQAIILDAISQLFLLIPAYDQQYEQLNKKFTV
mgnify:CR=1 FL=1